MKEWLTTQKGFAENKVLSGIERLNKCQGKKNQSRLDSFFKSTLISAAPTKKIQKGKAKGPAKPKHSR